MVPQPVPIAQSAGCLWTVGAGRPRRASRRGPHPPGGDPV